MRTTHAARRRGLAAAAVITTATLLTACSGGGGGTTSEAGDGTGTINIWSLSGSEAEDAAIQGAIDGYNASQSDVTAELRTLPADNYTTTILNTPEDQLPDVLQLDGPTVASFAYNLKLSPLGNYVSEETINNASDGAIAQGTYDDQLYALAQFDSAMGFYGNKSLFDAAGVSYPTSLEDAWTAEEFSTALEKLAAASPAGTSINIDEGSLSTEWGAYGFSPLVQSAGGNLIADGKAGGALDSPESVEAMTEFASWKQFSDSNGDGNAFPDGRVALSMSGHWNYPTYSETLGDDLLALPLPDMGNGPKTGAGSRAWGIGASTENGAAAGAFLDFLLNDENVTAMTQANGAPPATKSAFAADALYQEGGALALWGNQLANACTSEDITAECVAVYRPVTAGYPTVSANFSSALAAIWGGADPQQELSDAAQSIDSNFSDNNGYN